MTGQLGQLGHSFLLKAHTHMCASYTHNYPNCPNCPKRRKKKPHSIGWDNAWGVL